MAEPVIRKAITVLDTLSRDPETVRLAELRMKRILDEKSMIEGAKEEGKIEGILEGKTEGKLEERIQIAKNLLDILDSETIAVKTGLTIDEVNRLKHK